VVTRGLLFLGAGVFTGLVLLVNLRIAQRGLVPLKSSKKNAAGAVDKVSTFSNSQTVWALLVAGIERDDPRLKGPWKKVRDDASRIVDRKDREEGVQAAAFTLRALLVGGEKPDSPLVKGLVDALVAAQRNSGQWAYALDGSGGEDNILNSLIAAEALHVARTRGCSIPGTCWGKAHRGAASAIGSKGPTARGRVDAIDVTTNLALLVIARAGMLGEEAGSFDYLSLPDVQSGLAWLDRHFSIVRTPVFVNGALWRQEGGGAYFAWIFSLQRLAMLLKVDTLGGQRWHVTGSAHIRPLQRADGSFEEAGPYAANGSVRSTTDAVLFLLRATVPLTDPGASR